VSQSLRHCFADKEEVQFNEKIYGHAGS